MANFIMKTVKISNRTELRLTSKNSQNFVIKVAKSKFEKVTNSEGEVSFKVIDLEDPRNPRRNYAIRSESDFITAIMNRVYYQQQEKGVKNPIIVEEIVPYADESAVETPKTAESAAPKKRAPRKAAKKAEKAA